MKIVESGRFKEELKSIALYIKKDKLSASVDFVKELRNHIKGLIDFPYKYRQSIYFNDKNIRDMIFKGYTIIYEICDDRIEIITIFNKNRPPVR